MSGVSIETTLALWALSLRDVKARMRPLFSPTVAFFVLDVSAVRRLGEPAARATKQ